MARDAALFLTPEAPYPLAGGGALRGASLLAYLAEHYVVDVVVFREPGAPDPVDRFPPGLAREIRVFELSRHHRHFSARVWRNAARMARRVPPLVDRFAGFGAPLEEWLRGRRYSLGVIEHFWCAPYWEQVAAVCTRTVLDLHNVESVLHARCARTEPLAAAASHRMFRNASRALERQWLPRYSLLLATSAADAAELAAISPASKIAVYPNALPATPLPPHVGENVVVFSGNLEYHPNISAVRFFRREIWPELRARWPGLVWRLVGKNPHAVERYTAGDPRIETTGPVADAIAEIARARVAVAPLLAASGTRLKILEAWAAAIPVVSTTVGAEGLPARNRENILLSDNSSGFVDSISLLLGSAERRTTLGAAGRAVFEREFTWAAAWKTLDL